MSEYFEERESLAFVQYLKDNEIISDIHGVEYKELVAKWDIYGEDYMEYCRLYDFDYEIIG